jgi:hypothetical protein
MHVCPDCRKEKHEDEFSFYWHNAYGHAIRNEVCKQCVEADTRHLAYWNEQALAYLSKNHANCIDSASEYA